MWELKKVYQNIGFKAVDLEKGIFSLKNKFFFRNISDFEIRYEITGNGKKVASGQVKLDIDIAPQEIMEFKIPNLLTNPEPGIEYFISFYATPVVEIKGLTKGHIIASEQFQIPNNKKIIAQKNNSNNETGRLELTKTYEGITIHHNDFTIIFDNRSGELKDYIYKGVPLIRRKMVPNFWRLPTDNDKGNGMPQRCAMWNNI